jgi:ABC-type transporter Mla maintaining outer membrane lipid asymmetry permease subunit MlaE
VGSLTVVLLTGLFTGRHWRCRAARRWTSSARARWSAAGQRVDDQGTGPVLTALMLTGRIGSALPPSSAR